MRTGQPVALATEGVRRLSNTDRGGASAARFRPSVCARSSASSAALNSDKTLSAHDGNVATPIETVMRLGVSELLNEFSATA